MSDPGRFTVDTHLFRELGELLVGRDSTALIELIKNAYDADATEVIVFGEYLEQPETGRIIITDNGTGMTREQFEAGFLRVASRLKEKGDRRSTKLRRRYTGAKGIGRLAAHKLAKVLNVDSTAIDDGDRRHSIHARINWDKVETYQTLEDLRDAEDLDAVAVNLGRPDAAAKTGTLLSLTQLRRAWTPAERARFFSEVQSFEPPVFLTQAIRKSVVNQQSLLFEAPLVRLSEPDGQQFSVRLEGEFASGHDYWRLMEDHASWIIEIRCRPNDSDVAYAIAPTQKLLREIPDAQPFSTKFPHPDPAGGPFFDARIFLRTGALQVKGDQRTWATHASGVRVFMEGFRVLPYGEPRDDWLKLDADYTRRTRTLDALQQWGLDNLHDKDEGLNLLPNNNFFGGVFLVHEHASTLRTLVNREGFVPEAPFDHLVLLVRTGVDLCIRTNAAAAYPRRQERKEKRGGRRAPHNADTTEELRGISTRSARLQVLEDATTALAEARSALASITQSSESSKLTERIEVSIEELRDQTAEFISELSLVRVLASIGTQMAAFVHEIRALLGTSQGIERALASISSDSALTKPQRQQLAVIEQAVGDLRRALEREASYLMDIVSPDARRRRSRQRLSERFEMATGLIGHHAERSGIQIENAIPHELKSPPMFPAELTAVFTNLLSNAVKAAGANGRIYAKGWELDTGAIHILVENTGVRVDLGNAERWFQPFESTTANPNPGLGQGMGLGLTITRRLLDDYGAQIAFISPDPQFSTAVEIIFPESR